MCRAEGAGAFQPLRFLNHDHLAGLNSGWSRCPSHIFKSGSNSSIR
jgi:hypothetical protein